MGVLKPKVSLCCTFKETGSGMEGEELLFLPLTLHLADGMIEARLRRSQTCGGITGG